MKRSKLLKPIRDGVDSLPLEIWESIFNRLSGEDLKAVSLTCKFFLQKPNFFKKTLNVVHPNVSILSQHLKRFPQIKNLHLSHLSNWNIDEFLREIARSNISLEALEISKQTTAPIKTRSLQVLGSNPKMKGLKALTCKLYSPFDSDLCVVTSCFPNLEELNVYFDCYPVLDSGIMLLASKLNLLKKIRLSGKVRNCDGSLVALSVNCPFLKDVSIIPYSFRRVTENGVGLLLRNTPNLESLSLGTLPTGNNIFKKHPSSTITIANSIGVAKALTSLEFSCLDIDISGILTAIPKAKLPLENLRINNCNNFTVSSLVMVQSSNLSKLCIIRQDNVADEDLKLLFNGDVGNLTHIEISGHNHNLSMTSSTLFLLLTKCPSLVEISMRLTTLDVQFNHVDNDISLPKYPNIQNLQLLSCKISDELIKRFVLMFPNIKVLDLSYCDEVTSTGIEAILKICKFIAKLIFRHYPKAQFIETESWELPRVNNLEVLKLPGSCIDDEGLSVIGTKCPPLLDLNLSGCKSVTTDGIKQIVNVIKTLKYLRVSYCDVVDYGELLEWMLSTGNLASLKKISIGRAIFTITKELRDQFLHHGCLVLDVLI